MIPINPSQIPTLFAKAMKLLLAGDADQAEPLFQQIQVAAPTMAEVPFQLARIAVQKGNLADAETHLNRAIKLKPSEPALWVALADLARKKGDAKAHKSLLKRAKASGLPPKAIRNLEARLAGDNALPQDTETLLKQARAARDRSDLARALKLAEAGLKSEPRNLSLLAMKADVLTRDGNPESAILTYHKMLKIRPNDRYAMTGLAMVQSDLGVAEPTVLKSFDRAIAAHPKDNTVLLRKAQHYQNKGEFKKAEILLRTAIARNPGFGEAYLTLSRGHKFGPDDPVIPAMQAALLREDIPLIERSRIGFAMAKAMEDCKKHARVFEYLRPANDRMKAASAPYESSESLRMFSDLKAAYAGVDFTRPVTGASDAAPIFVSGLPRSGTTLVERILSNTGQVKSIGEAPHLMSAQCAVFARPAGGFPKVSDMADAEIVRFGEVYQAHLRRRFGDARVVDKAMMTLQVAGLIRLSMPRARIILVRRDPRDIGLSMYKNVFPFGSSRYSYDLTQLGQYIAMYDDMIGFWNTVAPGTLIEVAYEDLIADPEGQSRALLGKLGLKWDDDLLDLEKAPSDVKTLSVFQARQPIYKSSARSWEKYKTELAPLLGALGDLVD